MGALWSKKEEDTDNLNARKRSRVAVSKLPYHQSARQTVYVLKRVSSMFLDEDEDLAHEFYEECPIMVEKIEYSVDTVVRWTMKRIKRNLKPEGDVELEIPRLHADFPVILVDNSM